MSGESSQRIKVMGVVNVTPHSADVGDALADSDAGITAGLAMFAAGADIVDVGAHSTPPGACQVPPNAHLETVVDVVTELAGHGRVCIDTTLVEVAEGAIAAGATIINDVGATLAPLAGALEVGYIASRAPNSPAEMHQAQPRPDVVAEALVEMTTAANRAKAAGAHEVWIDPTRGFDQTIGCNFTVVGRLDEFVASGWPVVVSTGPNGLTDRMLAESDGVESARFDDRIEASVAVSAWSAMAGVDMVRVHDVAATVQTLQVVAA